MHIKETCKTIYDPSYKRFISDLVKIRHEKGLTQRDFASKSGYSQCFIAKTELRERRLDFIEIIRYMRNLGLSKSEITAKITEWVEEFVM